jgi:hypothetical protein
MPKNSRNSAHRPATLARAVVLRRHGSGRKRTEADSLHVGHPSVRVSLEIRRSILIDVGGSDLMDGWRFVRAGSSSRSPDSVAWPRAGSPSPARDRESIRPRRSPRQRSSNRRYASRPSRVAWRRAPPIRRCAAPGRMQERRARPQMLGVPPWTAASRRTRSHALPTRHARKAAGVAITPASGRRARSAATPTKQLSATSARTDVSLPPWTACR